MQYNFIIYRNLQCLNSSFPVYSGPIIIPYSNHWDSDRVREFNQNPQVFPHLSLPNVILILRHNHIIKQFVNVLWFATNFAFSFFQLKLSTLLYNGIYVLSWIVEHFDSIQSNEDLVTPITQNMESEGSSVGEFWNGNLVAPK